MKNVFFLVAAYILITSTLFLILRVVGIESAVAIQVFSATAAIIPAIAEAFQKRERKGCAIEKKRFVSIENFGMSPLLTFATSFFFVISVPSIIYLIIYIDASIETTSVTHGNISDSSIGFIIVATAVIVSKWVGERCRGRPVFGIIIVSFWFLSYF